MGEPIHRHARQSLRVKASLVLRLTSVVLLITHSLPDGIYPTSAILAQPDNLWPAVTDQSVDVPLAQTGAEGLHPLRQASARVSPLAAGFCIFLPLVLKGGGGGSMGANDSGDGAQNVLSLAAQCLPPDPAQVAPPVDRTRATCLSEATEFLYTASTPIQTGADPNAIDCQRGAVLRGRVLTRDEAPLVGVVISILDHPEFGQTLSRADGMFDLAVNGGGTLTVNYEKDGYLSAQRQVDAPWQDYAWLPDVVLIPMDTQVTTIDLSSSTPIQVARGSVISDTDGTRRATLFIPQGTQAELVLSGGVTQTLTTFNVRATEYTVGDTGPEAMPGELPPTSGYTYAVEYSVDEALAAGASEVRFSQPLIHYNENFLNFPVGMAVPVGSYDREQGTWIGSPNGRVVEILSTSNGLADLDIDGSGVAADPTTLAALGVTDAERQQLASLFQLGQSLWRVPITHFTPWDHNWPYGPPPDAQPPQQPPPDKDNIEDDTCKQGGSIIECQNQILGEVAPIVGAPFNLHYSSGYRMARNTLRIPLSGANVPASLKRIELDILIAGQRLTQSFPPAPNQTHIFAWDGKDAYGRKLQGSQPVRVRIGYVYDGVYQQPAQIAQAFAGISGVPITRNRARQEIILWQEWQRFIGGWEFQGLGGWMLSPHHTYDPIYKVLYLGSSERRSTESRPRLVITTAAGTGTHGYSGDGGPATLAQLRQPQGVAVGPDGSLYIADQFNHRVRRVGPDGIITTVAGNGCDGSGFCPFGDFGDGGPATQAILSYPKDVAMGPDGSLYIVTSQRIRRVGPDGIITTVAGGGITGDIGDGGPATEAQLCVSWNFPIPATVAVGSDGSLYIADSCNNRIRRVGPDGIITTVAGNGIPGYSGDGGPATQAQLSRLASVAIGPDGSLYIADLENYRIRRVGTDGIISTVAGIGSPGNSGDGGPATQARLFGPRGVAVGPDGSLYIAGPLFIRQVGPDGIITTIGGNGDFSGPSGDGGPATQAPLDESQDMAVGPDGSLYIAEYYSSRIRKILPALPGLFATDILIPAEDSSELYVFDNRGRHLRTLHPLTGATLYQFSYDPAGHLITVTDGDGNATTVERDAGGNPTAIIAPFGQRTTLTLDPNGYLASITNPAGETTQFSYTSDGLLTSMTDPRQNTYVFSYDALGRLTRDDDPGGGFQDLSRAEFTASYEVTRTTAMNYSTRYRVERLSTGDQRWINTFPDGTQAVSLIGRDGSQTTTLPDGSAQRLLEGPDPRWGMQSPLLVSQTITMPSGLVSKITTTRSVNLADPANLTSLTTQTDTLSLNGRLYISVYDAASRTFADTTPAGRQSTTTLDMLGRVVQEQVTGLNPASYAYDARGRLATVTQGSGGEARTMSFAYNTNGYLDTITDPLSRTVQLGYDAAGHVITQTLPDGRTILYAYDANGNLTAVTPPGQPAHTLTYTPVNLVSSYNPPDVGAGDEQTLYTYNPDRQLTQVTRPDGQTIDFAYDSAGRLSTLTIPRGPVTYAYHPTTGNLTTITAPGGIALSYGYDGSLLTSTAWAGPVAGSVGRAYDNDFRVTTLSVNGVNPISFQYDGDSLLTQAGSLGLTRNPQNGLLTGTTLGPITDTWSYSGFGEPVSYSAAYNGVISYTVEYTRDNLGRIAQKIETILGVTDTYTYTYDLAGRLIGVSRNGATVATYTYDSNGNRLSYTGPGGTVNGSYDNQDRLLQYGATTYTYTPNGELLTKTTGGQTTTYQYDALGNLMAATLPDGTQIEYLVDGQNRRIGKRVNGTLVQGFLYQDGLRPTAELDGSGGVASRFIYASQVNVPDYMIRGGVTYRILTDHLGSPRLVISTMTGQVVQRMDYDEFGNVLSDTNPGFQPFGFAGGIYDQHTKLTRFGARDYDAEVGRWTAKDPILFVSGDTNLYAYVKNNSVNWKDTNGLGWEPSPWDSVGGAIGALAVGAGDLGGLEVGLILGAGYITPLVTAGGAVIGAGLAGYGIGTLIDWGIVEPIERRFRDRDNNGIPDEDLSRDRDSDGIPDHKDPYPYFPATPYNDSDGDGIPNIVDPDYRTPERPKWVCD